jgi:tetratricopeptide (TPR) repeat protein
VRIRSLALLITLVAVPLLAHAEVDNERADRLFLAARKLLEEGNLEQACAMFEEALRYNPQAIGTRLNLARCEERRGRIASAVAMYREVADRAVEQQLLEFKQDADERIAQLAPDVPHLVIVVQEPPPDLRVLIDDVVIPTRDLERLPIDPGTRVLVVTAPGRVAYRSTFEVRPRDTIRLEVPPLAPSVVASSHRTLGKVGVVAGATTLAIGIGVGLVAKGRYDRVRDDPALCGPTTCSPEGHSRIESARTLGNVGTVLGVAGIATAAVGGYLWWRASRSVSVAPQLGRESIGVAAWARF